MVVFNCNACGEALKKNQVEKHTLRCRQCQALSCVDCGKDFWGNDYQSHTKCISENEKYCGKNYVPKVNKGEAKQEQWIEKVQSAIDRSVSNPSLKRLLERLKDYPNIPRKKAKFENFLKNSLRINSQNLINQVWDTLMSASEKEDKKDSNGVAEPAKELKQNSAVDSSSQKNIESKKEKENNTNSQEENSKVDKTKKKKKKRVEKSDKNTDENDAQGQHETEVTTTNGQFQMDSEHTGNKLNKRERKEERRKQRNKVEKKDKEENGTSDKVNSRKRKLSASEEQEEKTSAQKGEKRQRQLSESENKEDASNLDTNDEETLPKKLKGKKIKFNWTETILTVLQAKGEISLKKLQKKVLSEFAAQGATNYSEDNLRVKFDRKIKKMPQVKVLKDKAKLK